MSIRNLQKIEPEQDIFTTNEDQIGTLRPEDLRQTKFTLHEMLLTFNEGEESSMFKIHGGIADSTLANKVKVEQKIVKFRKHSIKVDGDEVLIVLVRDVTDTYKLKDSAYQVRLDQLRHTKLSKDMNRTLSKLHD